MRLSSQAFPKVIISASGMCEAGRIQYHLINNLGKMKNSIVFAGYQAEGTVGRNIKDGKKSVRIGGTDTVVEAQVHSIEGFSGHADQKSLIRWISKFRKKPKKIFVVHGEEQSSETLAELIKETFNIPAIVPNEGEYHTLSKADIEDMDVTVLSEYEQKAILLKDLDTTYKQFEKMVERTDKIIDKPLKSEEFIRLRNNILELQRGLLNINMMLGE
jgi:metallo-beta-lactamase family protein